MVQLPTAGRQAWSRGGTIPDLDEAQFRRWARLVEHRTGLAVPDQWKPFLGKSLRSRMREMGHQDYQSYFDYVTGRNGAREWAVLVDRLTSHETDFFRDADALALVRDHLGGIGRQPGGTVQLWSVGCATGEEAYTLAMVAQEVFAEHGHRRYFGVTATDLSLRNLEHARQALYTADRMRSVSALRRERHFTHVCEGYYQVTKGLRERVCFAQLNVLDAADAPVGPMDIIFCQNLLIYFATERRGQIATALAHWLKPGGLLIFGVGELRDWSPERLERVRRPGTLAFRRTA